MMKKNLLMIATIILYCWLLQILLPVCFPFLLAIICYFFIKPIIDYMEKHFSLHASAIGVSLLLVIYLVIVIGIGCLITYFVFFIIQQSQTVFHYFQEILMPFLVYLNTLMKKYSSFFMQQDLMTMIQGLISQTAMQVMNFFSNFLSHIPALLFSFFLFMISTFFLVLEYQDIKENLLKHSSKKTLQLLSIIKYQCFHSLKVYLKCQILLMVVCFFILCLGFSILKIQHAFFYALIIALLDFLPFIGVGIILLPMVIFLCLEGAYLKALYIFLIYLMINVIRNVLEPHMMNKELKIPSFLFLLSMAIHIHFFGFFGLVLSPIHINLLYSFLCFYSQTELPKSHYF